MNDDRNPVQAEADSPENSPENLPEADLDRIEGMVDEILNVIDEEEAASIRKKLRETAAASLSWVLKVQLWDKFTMTWPIAIYYSFRGNGRLPPRLEAYCADPRDWLSRVNDQSSTLGEELHAFLLESAQDFNFDFFYEPTPVSSRGLVHIIKPIFQFLLSKWR